MTRSRCSMTFLPGRVAVASLHDGLCRRAGIGCSFPTGEAFVIARRGRLPGPPPAAPRCWRAKAGSSLLFDAAVILEEGSREQWHPTISASGKLGLGSLPLGHLRPGPWGRPAPDLQFSSPGRYNTRCWLEFGRRKGAVRLGRSLNKQRQAPPLRRPRMSFAASARECRGAPWQIDPVLTAS